MAAAGNDYLFRSLLREQLNLDGRSPRRLAKDVNDSWGHISGFEPLTTATVRNWIRNRNPSTPRDWKQLAAMLQELVVSRQVAEQMFAATTKSLDVDQLRNEVTEEFRVLLTFRSDLPLVPHQPGTVVGTRDPNSEVSNSLSLVALSKDLEASGIGH